MRKPEPCHIDIIADSSYLGVLRASELVNIRANVHPRIETRSVVGARGEEDVAAVGHIVLLPDQINVGSQGCNLQAGRVSQPVGIYFDNRSEIGPIVKASSEENTLISYGIV